ncbi:MAG: tripartite tricarboxylate transporter TctB family protein [Peptococcaceae bacterium]|nr:tripartite tricarboxylate transporter TctB family protein [Peptococcaceae bacterium]
MKADLFAGIAGVMVSITAWVVAGSFPHFATAKAGPAFYPQVVAALFAVTSLALILQAAREKRECEGLSAGQLKKLAGVLLILVGYYFGMSYLGYFTATFIAGIVLAICVFRKISKETLILSLMTTLIICGGIYVIFQILLKAPLPRGILF